MSAENISEVHVGPNLVLVTEQDVEVAPITPIQLPHIGGEVVKVAFRNAGVYIEKEDPFDGAEKPFQMNRGKQVRMSLVDPGQADRFRAAE